MNPKSDYVKAHRQVAASRGRADDHMCVACYGPAHQWAYKYTDPNPMFSGGTVYSHDPSHYQPMCRSCHIAFDREKDPRLEQVVRQRSAACAAGVLATLEDMRPTYSEAGKKAAAVRRACSCGYQ